jgi:hypothetical protein
MPVLVISDSCDTEELDPETDLQVCRLRPVSLQRRVVSAFPYLSPAPRMKDPGANPGRWNLDQGNSEMDQPSNKSPNSAFE